MISLKVLPSGWQVRKLRHLATLRFSNVDKHARAGEEPVRLCNYTDVYYQSEITDRIEFMRATATRGEIERFKLQAGDVLVTKDSEDWDDIAVPAYVPTDLDGVICGYHLAQIRPNREAVNGKYLFYAFGTHGLREQFHLAANGVTRFGLSQSALKDGLFPIPPLPDQDAIVAFLDHKLEGIDRYLAIKRGQVERLEEQQGAIISAAVSHGVGQAEALRPTGLPWMPEVVARWDATRLKYVGHIQTGITLGKKYGVLPFVRRPYLRVANVQDGRLDLTSVAEISVPPSEAAGCELQPGDVLMTEGGDRDKLGRGQLWKGEISGCLHQNHIFAVRPDRKQLLPEYLVMVMRSRHGRMYFLTTAKQTTNLASTNSTTLRALPLFLPSVEEQRAILERVNHQTATLRRAVLLAAREITLMTEYRTTLIAEAVTGRLGVRRAD